MDLVTGLSFLKTASELATRIRESLGARDVKLDEVVARIIEIQGLISDGRTTLIDVQDQLLEKNRIISALEQDNRKLQEQLSKRQQGRVHDSAVWKVLANDTEEGPYCPNCYEKTAKFIQPHRGALNNGLVSFICTEHGKNFVFRVPVGICAESPSDRPRNRPVPLIRTDFPMR
jgi:hypothetical protein